MSRAPIADPKVETPWAHFPSDRGSHRAHLIGAGGAGMRSLARLMRAEGWIVTGSDEDESILDPAIQIGHKSSNVPADVQLVIASDAVPGDNCERLRACELGVPALSYAEMLGRLSHDRYTIAVAGVHGKSTTTAMLAAILRANGQRPSVVLGAEPIPVGRSPRLAQDQNGQPKKSDLAQLPTETGKRIQLNERANASSFGGAENARPAAPFVVEACEYNRNFLRLQPDLALILNLEQDHFDCYRTLDELRSAFKDFARRVSAPGTLVVHGDSADAVSATDGCDCRRILFGTGSACEWRLVEIESTSGCYSATILHRNKSRGRFHLQVLGRHNLENALATAVAANLLKVPDHQIVAGLSGFTGIRRRLEPVTRVGGVRFFDDYAHHPTAVTAGLAALREVSPPGARLWLLFQPHQTLRTECLLESFAGALQGADKVFIVPVFQARAQPGKLTDSADSLGGDSLDSAGSQNGKLQQIRLNEEVSERLTRRARQLGVDAVYLDCSNSSGDRRPCENGQDNSRISSSWKIRPNLAKWVTEAIENNELTPGDVVVAMGAGNIGKALYDVGQRI